MKISIVKIGGNVIDNDLTLQEFLLDFSKLPSPKVLVHGGGKLASEFSKKLDITSPFVNGRRITDKPMLDIAVMIYGGLINKNIVARLQALGCDALGLSGADANLVRSDKRSPEPIDFGWVGDVKNVNGEMLHKLINNGLTPVFCALTHDGKGNMLNTNADTIASEIAIALSAFYEVELYYCFEKNGVLKDVSDNHSVVEKINTKTYQKLKEEGIIADGMLPKLENCFYALNNGVTSVNIGNPQMIKKDHTTPCTSLRL